MPELFEQSAPTMTDNLTTAPGDLPIPEIMARVVAQRYQFRHDNTVVPSTPRTGGPVEIWAISGEDMPLEHAILFYTTDGSLPDISARALSCERVRISWDIQAGYLTHWRAVLPAQATGGVVRYRIGGWRIDSEQRAGRIPDVWAQDGQGFWFHFSGSRAITTFAYTVEEVAPSLPIWTQDAIIYQIFLDRFRTSASNGAFPANTDPRAFHGGTLRGVCIALPYLADLGVTCLWLSPINPAESYHRYDATDFYKVDPLLGTDEDLKELTSQAHALGMRVLLDIVPSHLSWHHPAFVSAQQDRNAPSFGWFTFDEWPDRYKCFLEVVPSLVSLNADNEQARDYIIGSAVQWLRDYGIDGFRLDHAIGQGMDFWTAFRRATREVSPDMISIGEVTDTPDCQVRYQGKLDYVLDFPLASALRHTFGLQDWDVQHFDHFLFAYEHFMAAGPGRVNFLDNHDMQRFLFTADNNSARLKMAALCQFTLDGLPVIYYGTEIGMSQQTDISDADAGGDAQARLDMIWEQDQWNYDLLAFYRALIAMRKDTPVLHHGHRRTIHVSHNVYAYTKNNAAQGEISTGDVIVLFNLSGQQQAIPLPAAATPREYRLLLSTGKDPVIRKTEHAFELLSMPDSGVVLILG